MEKLRMSDIDQHQYMEFRLKRTHTRTYCPRYLVSNTCALNGRPHEYCPSNYWPYSDPEPTDNAWMCQKCKCFCFTQGEQPTPWDN